jgi:hypothetical protein
MNWSDEFWVFCHASGTIEAFHAEDDYRVTASEYGREAAVHRVGSLAKADTRIAALEAEGDKLQSLIEDCSIYLKDGETPRQRMDRDHADVLSLMEMLAKDRKERDAARAERDRLIYVLGGVRRAIQTGRNEPLQIWSEQIDIAFAAIGAKP